jgi:hypothetical protein
VSARSHSVIPSRADGEGPLSCTLRYDVARTRHIAVARSLVVCATRDDSKNGDTRHQPI